MKLHFTYSYILHIAIYICSYAYHIQLHTYVAMHYIWQNIVDAKAVAEEHKAASRRAEVSRAPHPGQTENLLF